MRALVAIADGKSFLRAAKQLNLSQPALSRRIQKLKATVGARLLERTTRSVRLTPAGQEIVPLLRRLLDEMDGSLLGLMASSERQANRLTIASIPSATVRFCPQRSSGSHSSSRTTASACSICPRPSARKRCGPGRLNSPLPCPSRSTTT